MHTATPDGCATRSRDDDALVTLRRGPPLPARARATPVGARPTLALRVSVLEACQLRCRYCEPAQKIAKGARARWLNATEHARLAPLFVDEGVRKVRFTGGEPLLREDLPALVRAWRAALTDGELALTTNGLLLESRLAELVDAGLDRVHVHVDSLDKDTCRRAMGGGDPARALRAAAAARDAGLAVKLNVVVQRGLNDGELPAFLDVARAIDVEVRFIEMMDTGSAPAHVAATFIDGATILSRLAMTHPHTPLSRTRPSDPAERHRVVETGQVFGLIASDTRSFCDACNRIRMSAEGALRTCLYGPPGEPLLDAIRRGATDTEIRARVSTTIAAKESWHPSLERARHSFSMADVGG
jgi:cyclic pyranopterin phosphate synthase